MTTPAFKAGLEIARMIQPNSTEFKHSDRRKMRRAILEADQVFGEMTKTIALQGQIIEAVQEVRTTIEEF